MVWLYTSWLIVLFGVEVVYAHQNIRTFRREVRCPHLSHGLRELLVLAILQKVGLAFVTGTTSWTDEALAEDLGVSTRLVRDLLGELVAEGLVARIAGEPPVYHPARALEQVSLSELFTVIRAADGNCSVPEFPGAEQLRDLLSHLDDARDAALAGLTLNDLVRKGLSHADGSSL